MQHVLDSLVSSYYCQSFVNQDLDLAGSWKQMHAEHDSLSKVACGHTIVTVRYRGMHQDQSTPFVGLIKGNLFQKLRMAGYLYGFIFVVIITMVEG